MPIKLECPQCLTSYTTDRCGVETSAEHVTRTTVICMVCGCAYDAKIEFVPARQEILSEPGWFAKYVLRRQAQLVDVPGRYDVATKKR